MPVVGVSGLARLDHLQVVKLSLDGKRERKTRRLLDCTSFSFLNHCQVVKLSSSQVSKTEEQVENLFCHRAPNILSGYLTLDAYVKNHARIIMKSINGAVTELPQRPVCWRSAPFCKSIYKPNSKLWVDHSLVSELIHLGHPLTSKLSCKLVRDDVVALLVMF